MDLSIRNLEQALSIRRKSKRCNDGLLVWLAVKLVARLHREGAEADDVVCQHPPGQRSLLRLVLVGHDSERGKAKVRRKVDGVAAVLRCWPQASLAVNEGAVAARRKAAAANAKK